MGDQEGKHQIHHWSLREWLKILHCTQLSSVATQMSQIRTNLPRDSLFERQEVAQNILLDIYKGNFESADSTNIYLESWEFIDGPKMAEQNLDGSSAAAC